MFSRATTTMTRAAVQARGIMGKAPVIYFPTAKANPDQVKINTAKAIELVRAKLGEKPAPYTRVHSLSIDDVKSAVTDILASCGSEGSPLEDGQELTQMQVIERVLWHGIYSYLKNEGKYDWDAMEKWLVYTANDQQEFQRLKRSQEDKEKFEAYKAANPGPCLPTFDWAEEYAAANDREPVSEKRRRYDALAVTTFERDEAAIKAELEQYSKPKQDMLLDELVDKLTMLKPFLAKHVIQAKLIERNAAGQMTGARFMDWNPDARDLAELEVDTAPTNLVSFEHITFDETHKRYSDVRMRTKEEVLERMDQLQQMDASSSAESGGADSRRVALMAEIMKIQSRGSKTEVTEDAEEDKEAKEKAAEAARKEKEKEMEKYSVSADTVKSKGLLGLEFLKHAEA